MTLRAGKTQKTKEMIMGRDTYRMWLYIYRILVRLYIILLCCLVQWCCGALNQDRIVVLLRFEVSFCPSIHFINCAAIAHLRLSLVRLSYERPKTRMHLCLQVCLYLCEQRLACCRLLLRTKPPSAAQFFAGHDTSFSDIVQNSLVESTLRRLCIWPQQTRHRIHVQTRRRTSEIKLHT